MKRKARQIKKALVPPPRIFPAHLGTTPEEWRAKKRQEWLEVMQALERFAYGAAFVPAQSPLYQITRLADQVEEAINRPDWVCW